MFVPKAQALWSKVNRHASAPAELSVAPSEAGNTLGRC